MDNLKCDHKTNKRVVRIQLEHRCKLVSGADTICDRRRVGERDDQWRQSEDILSASNDMNVVSRHEGY